MNPRLRETDRQDTLLDLLRDFAAESRLPAPPGGLTLDTRLETDLGLDSLGRAELIARIERALDLGLPETAILAATPRELLALAAAAPPDSGAPPPHRPPGVVDPRPVPPDPPGTARIPVVSEINGSLASERASPPEAAPAPNPDARESTANDGLEHEETADSRLDHPAGARTLLEVLDWHLARHGDRVHLTFLDGDDRPHPLTHAALDAGAARVAARLERAGLARGAPVALMLPSGFQYFFAFIGILRAGGIPVPIYPPARPQQLEDHLRRHARILDTAGTPLLITVPEAQPFARLLRAWVPGLRAVIDLERLDEESPSPARAKPAPEELALLQYTSGSTGNPKGAMLSHADLLANIRAMGAAIDIRAEDVFVSWLPLYHDMGLIGAWLGSLYYGTPLVVMSPLSFLARPARWLQAIDRHRGTLSAAPNFAYELCLTRLSDRQRAALDLSAWRRAFNGAEPVSADTLRRFADRFAPCGLRPEALAPVYGLAEAAVGLAFPPAGRGPRIDRIDRARFAATGEAVPLPARSGGAPARADAPDPTPDHAPAAEPEALEIVACGRPLPGYQVRILDAAGRELPERREGRLQFRGPSATRGYYNNPEATAHLIQDGWHETGDRAYLADGELHLTGRIKDLIIRGGRNLYPYEVEQALGELPGIRQGCVAAFAAPDPRQGSERLVIVAETRERDPVRREALARQARERATDILGLPPDALVLVPPHAVLKTSSGKLRRADTRDRYLAGRLTEPAPAGRWRIPRLLAAGLTAGLADRLARRFRQLPALLYAAHAWGLLFLLAPGVWIGLLLLPRPAWRWRLARAALGLLRRLTAMRLEVEGLAGLPPPGQTLALAANHASYLDAFALIAALDRPCGFVAKRELAANPLIRWPLERLNVHFVERFDPRGGAADAARIAERLRQGESLIWFPEGTFRDRPGLLPFRMGAFAAAAAAGVPLVPVALVGTRACLTGDSRRPRPGRIRVRFGPPLQASGPDWRAAIALRERTRDWIDAALTEAGEIESCTQNIPYSRSGMGE